MATMTDNLASRPADRPSLRRHVGSVVAFGAKEQMIGIHAWWVVASVQDAFARRNRSSVQPP
jgi:hypothetical protein